MNGEPDGFRRNARDLPQSTFILMPLPLPPRPRASAARIPVQ
jgi:hypothetical protein